MPETQEIKITDHHLGYIKTFSGKSINLLEPTSADIELDDIASGLSKICRFGGQCREFYSVAQHSILVAHLVPAHCREIALMHDATEAYIGDVIKPLKVLLGHVYSKFERSFDIAIANKFGFYGRSVLFHDEIKKCDILALQLEDEAFRRGKPERLRYFYQKFDILQTDTQLGWPPFLAETLFKQYFKKMI